MPDTVYKNCGFLGFWKSVATPGDFKKADYDPSEFYTGCGFLGFDRQKATFNDLPQDLLTCSPPPGKQGTYKVFPDKTCTLVSCDGGLIKTADQTCEKPGTSCHPSESQQQTGANYAYAPTGECTLLSCGEGMSKAQPFGASVTGVATCPTGYEATPSMSSCREAAKHYGIPFKGSVSSDTLMPGCVVKGVGDKPAVALYNTNKKGTAMGGEQFVVCGRKGNDECVKVGAKCGDKKNYTWNTKGFCQGSCGSIGDVCMPGEKCCSSLCMPQGMDCPAAAELKNDASSLASQIHSMAGSINQVVSGFKNIT